MRVVFLGVGEACDERLPNTSVWVETEVAGQRRTALLDCGFTVPPLYWRQTSDPNDLDVLWISHFHGDHFFGVPALLLRFWEMKRAKPLCILGQEGIQDLVERAVNLAYPNFLRKFAYPLEFMVAEPGHGVEAGGFQWNVAENGHGQRDLAVRVGDGRCAVFYSGDGLPTPDTVSLARGSDLVVHEAFLFEGDMAGHGSVRHCIDFARKAGVPRIALVHLQRDERRDRYEEISAFLEEIHDFYAFLPEPGESVEC